MPERPVLTPPAADAGEAEVMRALVLSLNQLAAYARTLEIMLEAYRVQSKEGSPLPYKLPTERPVTDEDPTTEAPPDPTE